MKFFPLSLLMIFYVIPLLGNDAWARNNGNTNIISADIEKELEQLVDLPLKKKDQEIKKKLESVDALRQGFSPEQSSESGPAVRLTRYKNQLLQLQIEYIGEIESMLGGLYTKLNDIKMSFQQEATQSNHRDVKLLLKNLSREITHEIDQFDKKIIAIDLDYDSRRDDIIRDVQRKNRARRRK